MPGYCGKCNKDYVGHWEDHEDECDEGRSSSGTQYDEFDAAKEQCGWDDEDDEKIWNENFRD